MRMKRYTLQDLRLKNFSTQADAPEREEKAAEEGEPATDEFETYQDRKEFDNPFQVFRNELISYVNFGDFIEAYIISIHHILEETIEQIDKDDDDPVIATVAALNAIKPDRAKAMKKYIRELKNKLFDAKILLADFETQTVEAVRIYQVMFFET